jgi:arabinose-5-phosphate isomerase
MTIRDYAIQCIKDEAQAVLDLIPKMDEEFDRAVELIMQCQGKVIVTGVGKSGHIGAKIAATLASTGTPSFFVNPLDVYHGDLGVMSAGDVVIAISNSGQTDELLRFIPMVLHMEIPIIAMTADAFSENVTECLNAGMNGHIAKPIDVKLVIKEIRRIKEERS